MRRLVVIVSVCAVSALNSRELTLVQGGAAQTNTPIVRASNTDICQNITDLSLFDQDFTDVAKAVCQYWPSFLGNFPVTSVEGLKDTLNVLFEEGGMWSELQAKFNEANDNYCLRRDGLREEIVSAMLANGETTNCAPTLDDDVLAEYPEISAGNDNQELKTGYWANVKASSTPSTCDYRRADDSASNTLISIQSRPSGCKMVHGGKCYGDCPDGYRPTFLTGWFRPTCTSVCAATNHPVTCGVGCAASRGACAMVILNQIKEVAIAGSKVVAFFTTGGAGVALVEAVEQVIKLAEFAFNVISQVLAIAETAFELFAREEALMAAIMAVYEMAKTKANDLVPVISEFWTALQSSLPLFLSLFDAQFAWRSVDLGWIAGSVMQHGSSILNSAFTMAKAWAFGKCDIATNEVFFTIEDVGDQRVVGPWTTQGVINGKPRYVALINKSKVRMEWDGRRKSWSIWVKDTSFGRGWWFGWLGMGWRRLYETSSNTAGFPTYGWRRQEGVLPLPYLVSTTGGGV